MAVDLPLLPSASMCPGHSPSPLPCSTISAGGAMYLTDTKLTFAPQLTPERATACSVNKTALLKAMMSG